VLGLVYSSNTAFAQNDTGLGYSTEFIWGLNKNTSSGLLGGFILRKSIAISDRVFKTFGLEIINLKHRGEQRYSSRRTGNFFIWGKRNYLYTFRTQYGRDVIDALVIKAFPPLPVHCRAPPGPEVPDNDLGHECPMTWDGARSIFESWH